MHLKILHTTTMKSILLVLFAINIVLAGPSSCEDECAGVWPQSVHQVDYLVVGGGIGGGQTLADMAKASPLSTFALVEQNDYIGGNYLDIPVTVPAGYTVDSKHPPLIMTLGGARVNLLTMGNMRRVMAENKMKVYYSPFRNRQLTRGRDVLCTAPTATTVYAEFCSFDAKFRSEAFVGLTNVTDPSFQAYCYLTNSLQFPCDAMHPIKNKRCNRNVDGSVNTSPDADPALLCPMEACKNYPDIKSFLRGYLSEEYESFLANDNVGFFGDYDTSNEACAYLEFTTREWNTASQVGYPMGGMSQIPIRAIAKAVALGKTQVYLGQRAMCVRRNSGHTGYQVRTSNHTFEVSKFVFLNVPPSELGKVSGDVMEEIRAKPEAQFPKSAMVVTISLQWAPNSVAWYYDLLDKATGAFSYRAYGDKGCFSRLEIIDNPMTRYANTFRAVYSDFKCRALWVALIRDAENKSLTMPNLEANARLLAQVMQELRTLFPLHSIPAPIFIKGHVFEHAWFFGRPLMNVTPKQVYDFAAAPLGVAEKVCLIADGYNLVYSGWGEAALLSSRNCLSTRFLTGNVRTKLVALYTARDRLLRTGQMGNIPGPLVNEFWPPYEYAPTGLLRAPLCGGTKGGPAPVCQNW